MRFGTVVCLCIFILFIHNPCRGNENNSIYTMVRTAPLRDSLPRGLTCNRGRKICTVQKNEPFIILEKTKIRCALFLTYDWIKIKRLADGLRTEEITGYIAVNNKRGKPRYIKSVRNNGE